MRSRGAPPNPAGRSTPRIARRRGSPARPAQPGRRMSRFRGGARIRAVPATSTGSSEDVSARRFLRDQRHKGLLTLARAGHGEAFRRLYEELHGPLHRYLAPRVAGPEDAEDLVAQVFHRFLARLDRYDPDRGSVTTWVLTMARSALVDHHRARRPALPLDDLAEVLAGEARDPLSELVRDEEARRVRALLRELPPQTREMIALRFGQDLRHREIGAVLGLGEEAVRQRLSRALRDLRRRLRGRTARGGEVDYAV